MGVRLRRVCVGLGLLGFLSGVVACTMQPVPLSAQAGSTVMIPFGASDLSGVAYGGSDFSDPQRGSLVVQLDSAGGFELTTRLALVASPPVEAAYAEDGVPGFRNVLLLVDIPANAPLGTHSIVLVNRRDVGGTPVDTVVTPSPQTLRILPASVQAGAETIDGEPTQSRFWAQGAYSPLGQAAFVAVVPEPSFGLTVSTADGKRPADGTRRYVAYAQVSLTYPASTIDVLRVVAAEPSRTLVWSEDDGAGNLTVYGMARRTNHPTGLGPLRVVFGLDDPATPLDLAGNVSAALDVVSDQFGDTAIEQDWGVTVQLDEIR